MIRSGLWTAVAIQGVAIAVALGDAWTGDAWLDAAVATMMLMWLGLPTAWLVFMALVMGAPTPARRVWAVVAVTASGAADLLLLSLVYFETKAFYDAWQIAMPPQEVFWFAALALGAVIGPAMVWLGGLTGRRASSAYG